MLRVRDSEDVKGLGRIGLNRADFGDEEAMKLGFPLGQALGINAVDTRSMPTLDYNVDAVVAGTVHDHSKSVTDDLLRENPEELFDVSEELLKSSPENILDSPDGFSDAFDMSPTSLKDPPYPFNLGHEQSNPTTCASGRSESISTLSDVSMEQQIYAQLQRQQSSGSSVSPCRPDGTIDRSRESKKNSLTHLAKSLNEMEVSPPNVVAPPTDSNPYLEMVFMQNMQQSSMSGARPLSSPQSQGRSITDLSYNSPHQRAFTNFDGFMPNGSYFATPPNTTCEFKGPIPAFSSNTFASTVRPNAVQFMQNPLQADSFQNDFATAGTKPPSSLHFSQYNMARAPNVTITVPDPNLQDLRIAVATNGRAETSPKYPFMSPLSPTLSWSNNQGQGNVAMDTVEALALHDYNTSLSANEQQIQNMTRQLMGFQQQQQQQIQQQQQQPQQQQQRQNGFHRSFYSNEQLQYSNALQQGHSSLK